MRLIDADALIEAMKKTESEYENAMTCPSWWSAFNVISEQPTAYDIDNVVEELQENASRYTKKYTTPYGNNGYKDIKAISIHKAIEIVKQGGVADYVCEWRIFDNSLTGEPQWIYETTCGKYVGEEHTSKAFVYCPYCGNKIKIVGD